MFVFKYCKISENRAQLLCIYKHKSLLERGNPYCCFDTTTLKGLVSGISHQVPNIVSTATALNGVWVLSEGHSDLELKWQRFVYNKQILSFVRRRGEVFSATATAFMTSGMEPVTFIPKFKTVI